MTRPAAMMTSPSWWLLLGLTKGAWRLQND